MKKVVGSVAVTVLVLGMLAVVGAPPGATAQGGGTIEAEVRYDGAPVVETIKTNKDVEQCGPEQKLEKIALGSNKGLASAVVSVNGVTGEPTAKPAKAMIDQKGCKFQPRVVATMPGDVDIANSDGILHNIHTYSTLNPPVNKAQPKFKKVMTEKFEKPEIVKVTCDVHSWMVGWIAIMPHPYFGVTDGSGRAKITNIPPGKHTVEVWHETLGKQTKEVDVKAGQTAKVVFDLKK